MKKNKATVCDIYDSACTSTRKNIGSIVKEIQDGISLLSNSREGTINYSSEVRSCIIKNIQKLNCVKNKKMLEKAIDEMFDVPIRTKAASEIVVYRIVELLNEQPVLA